MAAKKTEWTKIKPEEFRKIVVELANQGMPAEKIGLVLRDSHGIPNAKVYGKRLGQVLKEEGFEVKSEYVNLSSKLENLKKHAEKNKHDYTAKRSLIKTSSRVSKLERAA